MPCFVLPRQFYLRPRHASASQFTLMHTARVTSRAGQLRPGTTFGAVKRHMECLGGPEDYVVRVMHERLFRFMHRI